MTEDDDAPQDPQNPKLAGRTEAGKFAAGNRINPGGRPKALREIEAMLDSEHRTVDQMRATFALIREVAHGVDEPVFYRGAVCGTIRKFQSAWMELYLNRVLGLVKDFDIDLTGAPPGVLEFLKTLIH